jgi:hypothetical protein
LADFKQFPQKLEVADSTPTFDDQDQMKQIPITATADLDRCMKLLILPNASELLEVIREVGTTELSGVDLSANVV